MFISRYLLIKVMIAHGFVTINDIHRITGWNTNDIFEIIENNPTHFRQIEVNGTSYYEPTQSGLYK